MTLIIGMRYFCSTQNKYLCYLGKQVRNNGTYHVFCTDRDELVYFPIKNFTLSNYGFKDF